MSITESDVRLVSISNRSCFFYVLFFVLIVAVESVIAAEFKPGVSAGVKYTDNAAGKSSREEDDLIISSQVAASFKSNEGPFVFDISSILSKENYTHNTFEDQRYFYLDMNADWEVIKDRFSWFLNDKFTQSTIRTINTSTPNNLQNTNDFTLGARINGSIANRQSISIVPIVSQYYFEKQLTNSNQYSLALNWNYQLHRLRSIGLSLSTRKIDYTEQVIDDTNFTNLSVIFNATTQSSSYRVNIGSTNVSRENGGSTRGFSGGIGWLTELSSRSKLNAQVSTELTDTASTSFNAIGGENVQVTTDVIRSSGFNVTYSREDMLLRTQVLASYQKVKYSESPLDRVINSLVANVTYPATQRLSVGSYLRYVQTEELEIHRIDNRYSLGGNLSYNLTREMSGYFNINYRKNDSTSATQSFDEMSVYFGLSYGFGGVPRSSGGF